MKVYEIRFSPEAEQDLLGLFTYIAASTGEAVALAYLRRIETWCEGFSTFPECGRLRNDLLPGFRVVGFERRMSVAFHITETTVVFDRFFRGRQSIERHFESL